MAVNVRITMEQVIAMQWTTCYVDMRKNNMIPVPPPVARRPKVVRRPVVKKPVRPGQGLFRCDGGCGRTYHSFRTWVRHMRATNGICRGRVTVPRLSRRRLTRRRTPPVRRRHHIHQRLIRRRRGRSGLRALFRLKSKCCSICE